MTRNRATEIIRANLVGFLSPKNIEHVSSLIVERLDQAAAENPTILFAPGDLAQVRSDALAFADCLIVLDDVGGRRATGLVFGGERDGWRWAGSFAEIEHTGGALRPTRPRA